LLNDPQFVAAARVLAQRVLQQVERETPDADGRRQAALRQVFRMILSRGPDDREREILEKLHAEQLAWFLSHPDEAAKLLGVGESAVTGTTSPTELAALAVVASACLNHDEFVMKR
ncbi:MAG: DUF1553 domain-containing protein, partial [Planctomycetaceae bacterium]